MLNVEPSNLVFLKTCNTEFDEIIIIFMDPNGRPLVNLTLLIKNRNEQHSVEPIKRKYVKGYGFL